MNKKDRQTAEAIRLAADAAIAPLNPRRFHPRGDYLFCKMRPEKTRGRIVLPDTMKVSVPIAEVLEAGPEVEKDIALEHRRYTPGKLVLFLVKDCTILDGELVFVAASKLLAAVDPEALVQPA